MALSAIITPSRQVSSTEPVTVSDLNVIAAPTCAITGALDMATQATFGAIRLGDIALANGSAAVNVWPGVTAKSMRVLGVNFIRLSTITAGSAVRCVIRTTNASPTVICYALISDIAANVLLPQSSVVNTVTGLGAALASGDGIEVVIADVNNAPISGTSGNLVVAVSAVYV